MDEPSEIMGSRHRLYRHNPYTTPEEARGLFGEYADQACLDHIRADMRSSQSKEKLEVDQPRQRVGRPRKKSEMPPFAQGALLLFFASLFFILGLVFINSITVKYGGWFIALGFWFLAFICFIGFLGAIITKKEEPSPVYHYELEMPPQYWVPRQEDEKQNEEETTHNKNNSEERNSEVS